MRIIISFKFFHYFLDDKCRSLIIFDEVAHELEYTWDSIKSVWAELEHPQKIFIDNKFKAVNQVCKLVQDKRKEFIKSALIHLCDTTNDTELPNINQFGIK